MNSLSIAVIKRGGIKTLEAALHRGRVAITKRNRVVAVVLTPAAYENLLAGAVQPADSGCALDWLLQTPAASQSGLEGEVMANRLLKLNADWA